MPARNTLANLLRLRGQNRAAGALQRGAISQRMWEGLGRNFSDALRSYTQQRREQPYLDAQTRAAEERIARDKAATERYTQDTEVAASTEQRRQRFAAVQAELTDAMFETEDGYMTFDRGKARGLAEQMGAGDLLPQIETSMNALDESMYKARHAGAEMQEQALEELYERAFMFVEASGSTPIAVQSAGAYLIANGVSREQIDQVLDYVGDDPARAREAVDVFRGREPKQPPLPRNPTEASLAMRAAQGDQEARVALELLQSRGEKPEGPPTITPPEERQRTQNAVTEFREALKLSVGAVGQGRPPLISPTDVQAQAADLGLDYGVELERASRDAALDELNYLRTERQGTVVNEQFLGNRPMNPDEVVAARQRVQDRMGTLRDGYTNAQAMRPTTGVTPAPSGGTVTQQAIAQLPDLISQTDGGAATLLAFYQGEGKAELVDAGVDLAQFFEALQAAIQMERNAARRVPIAR